jgi:hypothetical protein
MENGSTWDNLCATVLVSTKIITYIVLGPNPSLPDKDVGLTPGEHALRYGDRISPCSVRLKICWVYNVRIQMFEDI